jgi:hypothetical protein
MKKLTALLIVTFALISLNVMAQTYGSPATIAGGTNLSAVQSSPGVMFSNNFSTYLPTKTPTFYGISSTNEVIKGQFGIQIPSSWVLMTGTTNIYVFGSFTNSFAAGTNGGTWTTNFFFSQNFSLPAWFNIDVGTNAAGAQNTNTIYMP